MGAGSLAQVVGRPLAAQSAPLCGVCAQGDAGGGAGRGARRPGVVVPQALREQRRGLFLPRRAPPAPPPPTSVPAPTSSPPLLPLPSLRCLDVLAAAASPPLRHCPCRAAIAAIVKSVALDIIAPAITHCSSVASPGNEAGVGEGVDSKQGPREAL